MTRAGIYVRISQDRGGEGLGVQRQEKDCRALCERRGWTVGEVFVDDDVSAYSGKRRPAWERLLAAVDAGGITAIVCYHVDRLTRSPRELEDVISQAESRGLELATVTGDIDLATPTGRLVARMLGAAARHETEHKAERQRRERRQSAERGQVAGGGMRPYGYASDRITVVDNEADIVREAARRVLAGESLSSVCRDLQARGVQTPMGKGWTPTKLRRLLASARISGRREHTPRASYQGTRPLLGEIVATACWPAIISPDDSDRLRIILSRPERRRNTTANGRTYLLSGLLRCALCGGGMCGRPKAGTPRYVCPNMPGGATCGRMATVADATDTLVRDMVITALASPAIRQRLSPSTTDDREHATTVARLEQQLEQLAEDHAEERITRGEWLAARDVINRRLRDARQQLAAQAHAAPVAEFVGTIEDMRQRWEALTIAQQRTIVAAVVDRIEVQRADPHRRWDPDRFTVIWRA